MKRVFAAALAAFLIFSLAGCSGGEELQLHEDGAALEHLVEIADGFEQGRLKCYKYSTKDPWSLLSGTCEEAVFGTGAIGNAALLYRMRNPVVFIHWPSFDYYDGDHYYYRHSGEWFVDGYQRFSERLSPAHYGFDSTMFRSLKLSEDQVFRRTGGYTLHLRGVNADNEIVKVDMDVSDQLEPQYLVIRTYPIGSDYIEYLECYIKDYNSGDVSVTVPGGLDFTEVNYMIKDADKR